MNVRQWHLIVLCLQGRWCFWFLPFSPSFWRGSDVCGRRDGSFRDARRLVTMTDSNNLRHSNNFLLLMPGRFLYYLRASPRFRMRLAFLPGIRLPPATMRSICCPPGTLPPSLPCTVLQPDNMATFAPLPCLLRTLPAGSAPTRPSTSVRHSYARWRRCVSSFCLARSCAFMVWAFDDRRRGKTDATHCALFRRRVWHGLQTPSPLTSLQPLCVPRYAYYFMLTCHVLLLLARARAGTTYSRACAF